MNRRGHNKWGAGTVAIVGKNWGPDDRRNKAVVVHSPEYFKDGRLGYRAYARAEEMALRVLAYSNLKDAFLYRDRVVEIIEESVTELAIRLRQYIDIFEDELLAEKGVNVMCGDPILGEAVAGQITFKHLVNRIIHADTLIPMIVGTDHDVVATSLQVSTDQRFRNSADPKEASVIFEIAEFCQSLLKHDPKKLRLWADSDTWAIERSKLMQSGEK